MKVDEEILKSTGKYIDKFQNSTVLITGVTGMMGQNVVSILIAMNDMFHANIRILAHARDNQKFNRIFRDINERKDVVKIISDITQLEIQEDVDYIIHTAGVTGGSKQHVDLPMRTIAVALEGTKRVLEIAREKKSKGVVYLSTLEIYGNTGLQTKDIYETDGGYIDSTNVRSSYSESKRMCECMCASYTKQHDVPTYIARLTATFGYGVSYTDNRVFAQFARSVIEGKDIVLKSTGETVRNYCDAQDAAVALLTLLAAGTPGEAYNVANMDTSISIKDMALKFIALYPQSGIKLKFDLKDDATKLGYNAIMRNVLNSEKLMGIGWYPRFSLDDMIQHLVSSLRE